MTPLQIRSEPGIQRDGTRFAGDAHVDGQWVRFQRKLPRKIWGYRSVNKYLREVGRTLHGYTGDNSTYVHVGSASLVERFFIDNNYNASIVSDRTPSTLAASDANLWQFDNNPAYEIGGAQLIAQVAPNLTDISSTGQGQLFYGDIFGTDALTEVTTLPATYSASGGIVSLGPYAVAFGNDGFVMNSVPGDPSDYLGTGSSNGYVTNQKIVRALPLRGGAGSAPAGIFWSLDSVLRSSFVGGTQVFQYDIISGQSSILSAACAIEYDGIYYWAGIDRFLMFNGVVREVENTMNLNWFYDNINMAERQKAYVTKVPRFGEIWWCFPFGDATECTHAVIYNVRENVWYDTALPNTGRAAGLFSGVFAKPLMTGVVPNLNEEMIRATEDGSTRVTEDDDTRVTEESEQARYRVWVHEVGLDEIDGQNIQPLRSYYETADISLPVVAQANQWLQVQYIEPDFEQVGPITATVLGRANARAPEVESAPMTITEEASTAAEQLVYFKTQRRELRFRFESNAVGGDFQTGMILAQVQPGDRTITG